MPWDCAQNCARQETIRADSRLIGRTVAFRAALAGALAGSLAGGNLTNAGEKQKSTTYGAAGLRPGFDELLTAEAGARGYN